jgi:hypothetical protein
MIDETLLSSSVTVAQYRQFEMDQNRDKIADFIVERFTERYITPLRDGRHRKHGFCTMAICCLMIEALESFWRGWPHSRGRSEFAFCSFFDRNSNLSVFRGYASDFYQHVRCGILHQAETINGWRVRRDGPLLNLATKTINATEFHNKMENCLLVYTDRLKASDWDSEIWKNLRKKMKAIISHCSTSERL